MYEYAKHEFGRWLSTLDVSQLDVYQKRLIRLLVEHFDDIAAVGTAKGGRAKLLGKYIQAIDASSEVDEVLEMHSEVSKNHVQRLSSMKVEKFRGFGTPVNFSFAKQYTLFHGTNGSGKTSFCEALEYSMLGTIEEASARNISVDKYILHAGHKKAVPPALECIFTDGSKGKCVPDLAAYRFAFIEKNRIEAFSHMGATTAKNQTERIAALFGLSEFQEYVSGFTGSLDDRYLKLKSDANETYRKKKESVDLKKEQIEAAKKQLEPTRKALEEAIKSINNPSITDSEAAKKYLSDPETGRIPAASKVAAENAMPLISEETIVELQKEIAMVLASKETITEKASIILGNVESVNLLALYNSLIELQETWAEGVCPACHTPLESVTDNPFEFAKEAISSFAKIEEAKKTIAGEAKKSVGSIQRIKSMLQRSNLQRIFPMLDIAEIERIDVNRENFESLDSIALQAYEIIKNIGDFLDKEATTEKVEAYNKKAKANNEKYDKEVEKLQKLLTSITEKAAAVNAVENSISSLSENFSEEEGELTKLKDAAEKEGKTISFNVQMVKAYDSIVQSLSEYAERLPLEMATDLAEKAVSFYNVINSDDASFELIESLKLPVASNDKIIVSMCDGTEQDAMLLLSEGHVKILGLSILLAKAVQMNMPFLIFDDIVNAIDDDHRDGVAKLLIESPEFKDTQMILTCHGEIFVSKLEELVKGKNAVERYMFLPADSLDERGIVIRYRDPSIPLITARAKFEEGSLKDCAAKCRQAVECITGSLWNKMAPYVNGGISVKLRNLKSSPDLYQVTTALASASKPKNISGIEVIHDDLEKLVANKMWTLLNKGTHADGTIPEFTRTEVRELLELVEHLAAETKSLKIKPENIST